jgi:hypothetical protein
MHTAPYRPDPLTRGAGNRRHWLVAAAGAACGFGVALPMSAPASARAASTFELVGALDLAGELRHQRLLPKALLEEPPIVTRSRFPAIRVVSPEGAGGDVRAPLRVEVAFETSGDARIVPASFRAYYGMLKLDVTDKLRAHARLSEAGLLAEGASVPAGAHRLFLQIADDRGRFAERELRFRVAG